MIIYKASNGVSFLLQDVINHNMCNYVNTVLFDLVISLPQKIHYNTSEKDTSKHYKTSCRGT